MANIYQFLLFTTFVMVSRLIALSGSSETSQPAVVFLNQSAKEATVNPITEDKFVERVRLTDDKIMNGKFNCCGLDVFLTSILSQDHFSSRR